MIALAQEVPSWINTVSDTGIVVVLLTILYTGIKRYWVFGSYYEDAVKTCNTRLEEEKQRTKVAERRADQWQEMALRGTVLAEKAATAVVSVSEQGKNP